jgi:hypothetical protein
MATFAMFGIADNGMINMFQVAANLVFAPG